MRKDFWGEERDGGVAKIGLPTENELHCGFAGEKLIFIHRKIAGRSSLAGAQLLTSVSRKRRSALFFLMFLRRTDTATLRTKITTMKRTPITPAAIRGVLEKQKEGGEERERWYSKSEGESLKISQNTQNNTGHLS